MVERIIEKMYSTFAPSKEFEIRRRYPKLYNYRVFNDFTFPIVIVFIFLTFSPLFLNTFQRCKYFIPYELSYHMFLYF